MMNETGTFEQYSPVERPVNKKLNRIVYDLDEVVMQTMESNYDRVYHVVPFIFDEPLAANVVERIVAAMDSKLPGRAGFGAQLARKLTVTHIVVKRPMNLFQHGIAELHYNVLHGIGD